MPEPEPALALDAVTAGYDGGPPVVRDVSLHVREGEVVGLIGPNGSGKTTLVRVASRALPPRQGTVRVRGADPYGLTARQAARVVAVVPQDLVPAFPFLAEEVVLMGRSPYLSPWMGGRAEDWAAARRAMVRTDVADLASRPLDRLSGGERQRVILAQALAQEAPILLLDEPTTHLDLRHIVETLGLVGELARRDGVAVLAVFHDLNLAGAYCDRIYAISAGGVAAEGPPHEVLTPALVRRVFGIDAEVLTNPSTGSPVVVLSPNGTAGPGSGRPSPPGPGAGRWPRPGPGRSPPASRRSARGGS